MEFAVNRGIGRPAEFQGLKSQYLFIFAGGLLGLFVVFVVMFMVGVGQWFCIGFGVTGGLTLVYGTFYLNGKYGEHGLMKAQARRNHPRYVINRLSISKLFTISNRI
jgi:hypothetical protein